MIKLNSDILEDFDNFIGPHTVGETVHHIIRSGPEANDLIVKQNKYVNAIDRIIKDFPYRLDKTPAPKPRYNEVKEKMFKGFEEGYIEYAQALVEAEQEYYEAREAYVNAIQEIEDVLRRHGLIY